VGWTAAIGVRGSDKRRLSVPLLTDEGRRLWWKCRCWFYWQRQAMIAVFLAIDGQGLKELATLCSPLLARVSGKPAWGGWFNDDGMPACFRAGVVDPWRQRARHSKGCRQGPPRTNQRYGSVRIMLLATATGLAALVEDCEGPKEVHAY